MKKPFLRKESLTELSSDQLRNVAGALPAGGTDDCTVNVSDRSCVCSPGGDFRLPAIPCNVNVSDGSCACTIA